MTLDNCLPPSKREREREKEIKKEKEREHRFPHFQSLPFGVPRSWLESLGERLWVYETFTNYKHPLHPLDFDSGTSRSYV